MVMEVTAEALEEAAQEEAAVEEEAHLPQPKLLGPVVLVVISAPAPGMTLLTLVPAQETRALVYTIAT